MAELGKRLGILLVGSIVLHGIAFAVENLMDGKTILGKKKKPKDRTFVDWKGNVHLGSMDYQVC